MAQIGGKRPGAGRKPGKVGAAKRELMSMAKDHAEAALKVLVDVARDGKAPPAARVSAATAILDRGYGRPPQAVQHTGAGGGPIQTVDLTNATDDDLARLEALLGPVAGAAGGAAEADQGGEGEEGGAG